MATTELVRADRALRPASNARIRELLQGYRKEPAAAGHKPVPLELIELHECLEHKASLKKGNRGKATYANVVANLATQRKALATMGTSPIVSRAQWGARSPKSPYAPINNDPSVTYHYEGPAMGTFAHTSCASKVRAIQNYHMDHNGWNDIAYNAIICPHGYVFVGRWMGNKSAANGTSTGNATSYAACFLGGVGDPFPDDAKRAFLDYRALARSQGDATLATKSHSEWKATACPGDLVRNWENAGSPAPAGYNDPTPTPPPPTSLTYRVADVVDFLDHPSNDGGWMLDKNGGIYTLAPAPFHGSLGGVALNAPIVAGIPTATGNGYWLFGADGGVFTFGDAPFYGTYAALGDEYRAGQRAIIGAFLRSDGRYSLVSDRLEVYAI